MSSVSGDKSWRGFVFEAKATGVPVAAPQKHIQKFQLPILKGEGHLNQKETTSQSEATRTCRLLHGMIKRCEGCCMPAALHGSHHKANGWLKMTVVTGS